jgi:hypothetical protein
MARRTFDVIDVCEIFTHWHAGRSKNEVAGSLGLARNTVRRYVAAAEAAGIDRDLRAARLLRQVRRHIPAQRRHRRDYRLRDHLNIDLQHGHRSSGPNARVRRHDCPVASVRVASVATGTHVP